MTAGARTPAQKSDTVRTERETGDRTTLRPNLYFLRFVQSTTLLLYYKLIYNYVRLFVVTKSNLYLVCKRGNDGR